MHFFPQFCFVCLRFPCSKARTRELKPHNRPDPDPGLAPFLPALCPGTFAPLGVIKSVPYHMASVGFNQWKVLAGESGISEKAKRSGYLLLLPPPCFEEVLE